MSGKPQFNCLPFRPKAEFEHFNTALGEARVLQISHDRLVGEIEQVLYANAHRGKVRKADRVPVLLGMIEEEPKPVPSKGWAKMIRKVYEVDPLVCPKCGGRMKIVAFLTEYAVVDRIIRHLELTFAAEKPPPAQAFEQVALMADASQYSWRRTIGSMSAAEESADYE